MQSAKNGCCNHTVRRFVWGSILGTGKVVCLSLGVLTLSSSILAQAQQPPKVLAAGPRASADQPLPEPPRGGSLSGTVLDPNGGPVAGARVVLVRGEQSQSQEVLSGDDGQFSFPNLAPGTFQLTITAEGFADQTSSCIVHWGETCNAPPITLALATVTAEINVSLPPVEVAEAEVKAEVKQRVFGVIPNFYVSYVADPTPLDTKQKFELAWKTMIDPVTFGLTGAIAGVQQAQNDFSGYGQGGQGFAKRFGATYANTAIGTFLGSAILPSLLKQDPRYFYKGGGNKGSRFLYAIANSVICKGDNKHWQPNYSNILGNFAAGGISNLYYPAKDRAGATLTIENGLIGIGTSAAYNVIEEFLMRKLTPHLPNYASDKP